MKTRKRKILCVDDEKLNLDFLEAVLVREGYDVIKAESGIEALSLLSNERMDLVIADAMMPRVNGLDICKTIKQHDKLKKIPVILITGVKINACRSLGVKVGAEDFLERPFQGEDIAGKVGKLVKIKDLNERLESSYACINVLNSFGEVFADSIKQRDVDLLSGMDALVAGLLKNDSCAGRGPKILLLGILSKRGSMHWYHYELSERIKRTLLALDIGWKLSLPDKNTAQALFYNEGEIKKPGMKLLLDELRNFSLDVSCVVSYLTDEICIVAVNYGRVVDESDVVVLKGIAMQGLSLKAVASRIKEEEDAFSYIVRVLARASGADERENSHHLSRIAGSSVCLAAKLGLSEQFVSALRTYAPIRDIGNVCIPSHILKKPGNLSRDEFYKVQKHTLYGAKIFGDNRNFRIARNISLAHHERWDGTGYPNGLRGEKIPIEGRIINIADQYDALRKPRSYRAAYSHKDAFSILIEGDGRTIPPHFDPHILQIFKESAGEFEEIYDNFHGFMGSERRQ